jgi:hypothetical protein
MRVRPKVLFAIAVAFLALAWWLQHRATLVQNEHDWTPLIQEIKIKPGTVLDAPFRTDLKGKYEISLDIDRKLPFEKINCLLGLQSPGGASCESGASAVSMSWVLSSGERTVASGSSEKSTGAYWGRTIGRVIGGFQAEEIARYKLRVDSATDGAQLNSANPKIIVAVNPEQHKGGWAAAGLFSIAALVCGAIGSAIIFGLAAWGMYRKLKSFAKV